jgi:hypothetical protein
MWMFFEPLPTGTVVSVQIPHMFPFENVKIEEGPSEVFSAQEAPSTPAALTAKLVAAIRTKTGDVQLRLRIERARGPFDARPAARSAPMRTPSCGVGELHGGSPAARPLR